MNEYNQLKTQIKDLIFDALEDSSYHDRYKSQIVDRLMAATGMTKYSPDYRALYVDMCYRDMARIDGVNIEDYP